MKNKNQACLPLLRRLFAAGLLLAVFSTQAATYTWTTNTSGSLAGDGAGTWSTAVANWRLNNAGVAGVWVNNSDAIIGSGGTPGTITLSGNPVVNNLTFAAVASGSYGFSSSTLRLGGSVNFISTITVPVGVSADIGNGGSSSTYLREGAGANGLIATGGGTLLLTYTGTATPYTGPMTIQGGTAVYVGAGFLSAGNTNILTSGTLGSFNSTARAFTKPINLNGNFTLGAPSPRNGALTFGTGTWTLSGGTYTLTVDTIAATINSAIGQDASSRGLTFSSLNSGTLTLNNTETYTGNTTINSGILALGASGALNAASGVSIAAGAKLDVSALATWTLGSTATLTASGTGITVGTTAADIKGGTTVALGTRPISLTFTPTAFAGDTTHPSLYLETGALSLGGNAFTVNNAAATPLGTGTYRLIQQASGSVTASGTPTVLVTGSGVAGGTQTAISINGGNVDLVISSANPAVSIQPETAANGSGTLVGAQTLGIGSSITAYAVSRDSSGAFIANVTADSWSLANVTGGVVPGDLVTNLDGKSAVFTGNSAGTASISVTLGALLSTNSGTLTVQCSTASVSSLSDKLAAAGATANFTVSAGSSSLPAFQWQISTDNGGTWNNVSTGSGGNTASYTTPAVTLADAGKKYRGIVSVACDSSSVTSSVATLFVADPANTSFRTITNGNWNSLTTWQESPNNGANWLAAIATPTDANSTNILVSSNVVVTASVQADDLLVQSSATLSVNNATLTIGNGTAATDCDVLGTIQTLTGGSVTNAGAGLTFENASSFVWNNTATPIIPSATWANGSLCKISATAAATVNAIGVSGQNFYDFTWDTTVAGQSTRTRLDLQTNSSTTIRRNFSITIPNTATASVTLGNGSNVTLTVGGNVTFVTGTGATTTKVLYNSASGQIFYFKIAGNLSATGYLDGFAPSTTTVEFNGTGAQALSIPTGSFLLQGTFMGYQVDNGSVVTLNTPITTCQSFTVNSGGALNFSTNQIGGGTNLVLNSGGTIYGNGTNQIASVNTNLFGGTLNLTNNFPAAIPNGTSFKLFGGVAYSGSFAAIVPATPGAGQVWDTSQLVTNGTLVVASGSVSTPVLNGVVLLGGTNLVLSGTNGTPNTGFTVCTSTNLAIAVTNWTVAGTGTFTGTGGFSYTNSGTTNGQSFFIIRAP